MFVKNLYVTGWSLEESNFSKFIKPVFEKNTKEERYKKPKKCGREPKTMGEMFPDLCMSHPSPRLFCKM